MLPRTSRYGWIPDTPDPADPYYAAPAPVGGLPTSIDLRADCPAVYDQGDLGSCTANAIAGNLEFLQKTEGLPHVFTPSRLFIYYNERAIEDTIPEDCGAQIRDGIRSVSRQGAPPESLWPYDPAMFAERPSAAAYDAAIKHTTVIAFRLRNDPADLRGCLASSFPFIVGMRIYESFEDPRVAQTGIVPMPGPGEGIVGGHALLVVGYDDAAGRFLIRNSWGPNWGMDGYCTIPYDYLLDPALAQDLWTIRVTL